MNFPCQVPTDTAQRGPHCWTTTGHRSLRRAVRSEDAYRGRLALAQTALSLGRADPPTIFDAPMVDFPGKILQETTGKYSETGESGINNLKPPGVWLDHVASQLLLVHVHDPNLLTVPPFSGKSKIFGKCGSKMLKESNFLFANRHVCGSVPHFATVVGKHSCSTN